MGVDLVSVTMKDTPLGYLPLHPCVDTIRSHEQSRKQILFRHRLCGHLVLDLSAFQTRRNKSIVYKSFWSLGIFSRHSYSEPFKTPSTTLSIHFPVFCYYHHRKGQNQLSLMFLTSSMNGHECYKQKRLCKSNAAEVKLWKLHVRLNNLVNSMLLNDS